MTQQALDPALVKRREGEHPGGRNLSPTRRPDEFRGLLVHRSRRLPRKGSGDQDYEYEDASQCAVLKNIFSGFYSKK